ncbi:MAG: carboxylesterase family protein, partial [Colwellia sp.]
MIKENLVKNKLFNGTQINYGLFSSKKPRWSLSTMDETEAFSTKIFKTLGENNVLLLDDSNQQSAAKGTIDVNEPSSKKVIAPQLSPGFDLLAGMSIDSGNIIQNEQCLKLNVFVPEAVAEQPNQLLPVMVWIHGGGFQIGSGSLPFYDGQKLANKANAIVVSINYRLGALGFLRLCDISDGEIRSTGNEGLEDQITALKWINRHITQYGGNKDNVTLFGESAGAMSIACLLATTKSKGLFHKAILQSGAGHTYSSIEKANEVAAEFVNSAKALGYTLEDLPTLTTEQILAIQKHFLARPEIYKRFGM